jgi:hypothetical protein
MADTHQTILDEVVELRRDEWREKEAVADRFLPRRRAIQARCGDIGHVLVIDGPPNLFQPGVARRKCLVCGAEEG